MLLLSAWCILLSSFKWTPMHFQCVWPLFCYVLEPGQRVGLAVINKVGLLWVLVWRWEKCGSFKVWCCYHELVWQYHVSLIFWNKPLLTHETHHPVMLQREGALWRGYWKLSQVSAPPWKRPWSILGLQRMHQDVDNLNHPKRMRESLTKWVISYY